MLGSIKGSKVTLGDVDAKQLSTESLRTARKQGADGAVKSDSIGAKGKTVHNQVTTETNGRRSWFWFLLVVALFLPPLWPFLCLFFLFCRTTTTTTTYETITTYDPEDGR